MGDDARWCRHDRSYIEIQFFRDRNRATPNVEFFVVILQTALQYQSDNGARARSAFGNNRNCGDPNHELRRRQGINLGFAPHDVRQNIVECLSRHK